MVMQPNTPHRPLAQRFVDHWVFLVFLAVLALLARASEVEAQTLQEKRWDAAYVLPHRQKAVDNVVARIVNNRARYEAVSAKTNVPWWVIASLNTMESGGSFGHHLHEGSSLKFRTCYVPKGRPKTGNPPFSWAYSAIDALEYDKMGTKDWWSLHFALDACEGWNGYGYRKYHPETPTQYLWAWTTAAKPGRYVSDGVWSSTAVSQQAGVVAMWRSLERLGVVNFKNLKRSY